LARGAEFTLRARHVFVDPWHVLSPGEVVVQGGLIRAVRHAHGRVPDVALLPGLVNAHVHLQLPALPQAPREFVPWIGAVMQARKDASAHDDVAAAKRSLRELLAAGTTAVGEVDSTGHSPAALRAVPLAGRCYRELIGFDLDQRAARKLITGHPARGTPACARGLSPHAPYSVSASLFRAAAATGMPLMIHAAETAAEQQFLRTGRGPFRELLQRLGRLPPRFRPPGCGAVEYLGRLGVLGHGTALVHCQHLQRGDADRIAAAGATVVVCPGTIRFFHRGAPPVPTWLARGIAVALGTDSRASNTQLSLVGELRQAARLWPSLPPAELLGMATVHGARALGRPRLGRLAAGGRADVLAVRAGAVQAGQVLAAFVHGRRPVQAVWLCGHSARVLHGPRR
jgi:cytosine/adenosine deaminase-related metal-dependent hydrolase